MKILGITAEYNPLHNGHESNITRSKEISGASSLVVAMSGNFVQRGEPALCDKWRRTKMALMAGADLVIELPLCCASASAGYFAAGATKLLEQTGIVNCLSFGSEWADIGALKKCAESLLIETGEYKSLLRKFLKLGMSYPAARAKAYDVVLPDTPNNILGMEYIKGLMEINSEITPYTVPRATGSAKELRDILKNNAKNGLQEISELMPFYAWGILKSSPGFADLDNLSPIFHYILRTKSPAELESYLDVSEGIENLFLKYAKDNQLISDIINAAKTKRYTYLRLQRAALHIILGITKVQMPEYIRVLGFRRERADLLRLLEEKAALPVVTNLKNTRLPDSAFQILENEINSTKIYSLAFAKHVYLNEYIMPLIII